MSDSFIGGDEELVAAQVGPGTGVSAVSTTPIAVKVVPSAEVTQFAMSLQLLPSNNSEANAVKSYSWYCGNCYADKQVWVMWYAAPAQGQTFAHKIQWCPWDSTADADWVDDLSIGEVDLTFSGNSTRVLIPITRYGAYLRLKIWQTGNQSVTLDAYGMGKWS